MVGLSQSSLTLISTILGILTAASPFILTNIYNKVVEYPELIIDVTPIIDSNKTEIKISNIGFEPIKDLFITVKTSKVIKNIENVFSTRNITIKNPHTNNATSLKVKEMMYYNFSIFELKIPTLIEGKGDIVLIQTDSLGHNNNYICNVHEFFAVYNEGSKIFTSSCEDTIVKNFKHTVNFLGRNAISIILILAIGTFLFFYSYRPYIRKLIQRSVIANIKRDLLDARNILKANKSSQIKLPCREDWSKYHKEYSKENVENMGFFTKRIRPDIFDKRDFLDSKDYILIDDYYKKVKDRESMNKILDWTEINTLLLYYIENILDSIDWKKYIPQRPLYTTDKVEAED